MKQKNWLDKVGDFLEGKGFYIVLFLCVAAIGISGYFLFSALNPPAEGTTVALPTQVAVRPSPAVSPSPVAAKPSVSPTATPTPAPTPTPTPVPTATPAPTPTAAANVYTWPVKGEILRDSSLEVMSYDETLGEWRVHSGVDIAAEVGTQVKAMATGTVTEVTSDDMLGTQVVIDHGSGLTSVYCNLAPIPTVEIGDSVVAGAVIGSVGSTAMVESAMAPHLHLEVYRDGTAADPARYLP